MIQQEKYGGEKFLIVAFVHMLTNANALYEEPPQKPNNQWRLQPPCSRFKHLSRNS